MWNAWSDRRGRETADVPDADTEKAGHGARVRCQISMSLDGFIAGPGQCVDAPLGEGGEQLHEWVFPLVEWREPHGLDGGEVNASSEVMRDATAGIGATVMGRNMFGGGPGDWGDGEWTGWWGRNPPFHHPVFVLTHHPREPLELEGGTTFTFVTEGIDAAIDQAREAAAGADVAIGGGAETIQQAIRAGLLDEMWLHVVPVLLGSGQPLFASGLERSRVEQRQVIAAPGVTHLKLELSGL